MDDEWPKLTNASINSEQSLFGAEGTAELAKGKVLFFTLYAVH